MKVYLVAALSLLFSSSCLAQANNDLLQYIHNGTRYVNTNVSAAAGASTAMYRDAGGTWVINKIPTAVLAVNLADRANHTGTQLLATISDAGTLAGLSAVGSAQITNESIVNEDINAAAAIDPTKIAGTAAILGANIFTGQQTLGAASATGAINISPTWNNAGTAFAGVYGRITNTASASGAMLVDIGTVASGSLFNVSKDGGLTLVNPSDGTGVMIWRSGATTWTLSRSDGAGGTYAMEWRSNNNAIAVVGNLSIGTVYSSRDTILQRDAAGVLALANSTSAQTFRVYRTVTDSSNYERLAAQSGSGYFEITPETAGTGTDNINLRLGAAGSGYVRVSPSLLFNGQGSDPASPSNGEVWYDSTSNTFNFRQNGATVELGSGGEVSDPNVAYIRSDGNDTTGDGSPGAPFLTIQEAYDEGFLYFDVGVGVTGHLTTDAHKELFFRGRNNTAVGAITTNGFNITLHLHCVAFTHIFANGADGNPGTNGGNITVYSDALSSVASLNTGGGNGSSATDGDGGNGGDITVIGPLNISSEIVAGGGIGDGSGANGTDGNITLTGWPRVPTLVPDAATVIGAIINGAVYTNTYP